MDADDARATNTGRRALVVIAIIAGVLFLERSRDVTIPLAFAIFLIALFWPLYVRLERRLPPSLAAFLTLSVFLIAVAILAFGLIQSGRVIAEQAPQYSDDARRFAEKLQAWSRRHELPIPTVGEQVFTAIQSAAADVGKSVYDLLAGLFLVIAYMVLGFIEVRRIRRKLAETVSRDRALTWLETASTIARDFQRYVLVRTGIGLITAVGVGVGAWAIGLQLAFIWALSSFLLNYIPTLGSILAVLPPVIFALVQKQSASYTLLTLGVMGGYQLIIGIYIDPVLQGRYLRLSPLLVVLSIVFWSWIWGIPGAFIAMPATTVILLICMHTKSARWAARLLVP